MEQRLRETHSRHKVVMGLVVLGAAGLLAGAVPLTRVFAHWSALPAPLILTLGLLAMAGVALYGVFRGSKETQITATVASIAWLLAPPIYSLSVIRYVVPSERLWWAIGSVLLLTVSGLSLIFGGISSKRWAQILGIALGCGGIASAVIIVIHALRTNGIAAIPRDLAWLVMVLVASSALIVHTFSERIECISSSIRSLRLTSLKSGIILNATIAAFLFLHVLLRGSPRFDRLAFAAVAAILATSVVLLVRGKTIGLLFAAFGSIGAIILDAFVGSYGIVRLPSLCPITNAPDGSVYSFLFVPSIVSALLCIVPMVRPIVDFFRASSTHSGAVPPFSNMSGSPNP